MPRHPAIAPRSSDQYLIRSGAAVPRALILLKNISGRQDAAQTNDAGEYKFAVPAGSYALFVRAPGFAEFQKTISVPVSDKMNITLGVGPVSEAVEVVGKAIPPAQAAIPRRIRVGGNVQATKLVSMTKPAYPPGPQAAGIEGTVLLQAVISMDGNLLNLSLLNTSVDAELARAAMVAVGSWHYQPTLLNGQPVEVGDYYCRHISLGKIGRDSGRRGGSFQRPVFGQQLRKPRPADLLLRFATSYGTR